MLNMVVGLMIFKVLSSPSGSLILDLHSSHFLFLLQLLFLNVALWALHSLGGEMDSRQAYSGKYSQI